MSTRKIGFWAGVLLLGMSTESFANPSPFPLPALPPRIAAYQLTPLHWAARSGEVSAIRELLSAGAAIEARDRLQRTPIHLAVLAVSPEAVRALLQAGADVNSRDQWGATPLKRAELLRDTRGWDMTEVIETLKARGARS